VVDLGVKGGPNHPAIASLPWTTPATAGHYCIKAHLEWFDDSNPNNNVGQENTNVATASSPARYSFLLRNEDREHRHAYRFEVDTYEIPEQADCRDAEHVQPDLRHIAVNRYALADRPSPRDDVRQRHDRGSHPVPADWAVAIDPIQPVLAPLDELDVAVEITPPEGFVGSKAFNIDAFHEDGFAGGVTLVVTSA
jgi:hypothetical protein